jgi:predicted transcriptional regulator
MTSKKTPRSLELRVGAAGDALDRFEAAWNRLAEGRAVAPLRVLTVQSLPLLLKTLTPARWSLLERLGREGPVTIYELAKRLERDYKNVHTDVTQLAALGLIERRADGAIAAAWDAVRAELRLGG